MEAFLERLATLFDFSWQGFVNIVDVLLVAYLVYRLLKLVRGRRAWNVVVGIGVFVLALVFSDKLGLKTLNWILEKATVLAPVAVVLLFLPELRQAIEGFAKVGSWSGKLIGGEAPMADTTLEEVVKTAEECAETSTGALIVLERGAKLDEIAANGVPVMGTVTAELLGAIFYEGNPLHDGAVLIRDTKVLAAACRLPMSESVQLENKYHMRHRAGLGMSEHADCVVVIVSEERGAVSLAIEGEMIHLKNTDELLDVLKDEFKEDRVPKKPFRLIPRKKDKSGVDSMGGDV